MPALRFPEHFPPTARWAKFFIGVRWLGPNLSFFKDLKAVQAQRDAAAMASWGGGMRQALASDMSEVLAQQLGWKSAYFLPDDSAAVAFHGPRFDFIDPESAFDAVIELLEVKYGIAPPDTFWQSHGDSTMGALVDALLGPSA